MLIFETFLKRKSDPNIHLNAPFKKKFSGGRPQTPIRAWRFATCNFRNLKKKILAPLPTSGYALDYNTYTITIIRHPLNTLKPGRRDGVRGFKSDIYITQYTPIAWYFMFTNLILC